MMSKETLTCANERVALSVSADGLGVEVTDVERRCTWRLVHPEGQVRHPGEARMAGPAVIEATHPAGDGGEHRLTWCLEDDHVAVTLECIGPCGPQRVPAPGRFIASVGEPGEVLVPQYQGAWLRHTGETWETSAPRGGHTHASMGMAGYLNSTAGLLITPDELVDWLLTWGSDPVGPYAYFSAVRCAVSGWQPLTLRICPCGPSITAVAKRYRKWAQARGEWVPWETKIAAKPMLEGLFGALMTFIGYVHDEETDYVASTRALKAMGFDSVFIYPTRFASYTQEFTMAGGQKPIWLTDATLEQLKAIDGVRVSPWAWTIEGIDDGSEAMHRIYRHGPKGELSGGWSMDNQRWQHVCTPYQVEAISARLATDMQAMDWLHFDVNAVMLPPPCFRTDHRLHENRPLPHREEVGEVRELLSVATVGNRVVSSEGFNDAYTAAYDIGSTKMMPLQVREPRAMPVPLTMLVYHDCCMHDWWELHSYNENPCWNQHGAHSGVSWFGMACSGEPQLKAAQDALYGLPPNAFPFGYQYGWETVAGGETYGMRMRMSDPGVKEALACALPVAKLHKEIGKLELTDLELLSADGFVQRTTFADGTRIVANLGPNDAEVVGVGTLAGRSWQRLV